MNNLDSEIMRLHLPYHRTMFSRKSLNYLIALSGFKIVRAWKRSYMDTVLPFANYRFLDEFNKAYGHELERAFDPDGHKVSMKHPTLLFWAFLGFWVPSAFEPAVATRKGSTHEYS